MYRLGKRIKTLFNLLTVDLWFSYGFEEVVLTVESAKCKRMKISFSRPAPLKRF